MSIKFDVLSRAYLGYILMCLICLAILGKAFYIQQVEGKYWLAVNKKHIVVKKKIEAERGTIYTEGGQILRTSIPKYDIYFNLGNERLRRKQRDTLFDLKIDSLSVCLANAFDMKGKDAPYFRSLLEKGFEDRETDLLLAEKAGYAQYSQLKGMPLLRDGKEKLISFYAHVNFERLNPYGLMGFRTIGLDRKEGKKVGLEEYYDDELKGDSGTWIVRNMGSGIFKPFGDVQQEPENGNDIRTTIDEFAQSVTEKALYSAMVRNNAEKGCAIVMETSTGKIKALANLGRNPDYKPGNNLEKKSPYIEAQNYALIPSDPGSTFKLVTMMNLLEDDKISLDTKVDIQGGEWTVAGLKVADAAHEDDAPKGLVTAKEAFEMSSNVGMSKLSWLSYKDNPSMFTDHLHKLMLDTITGIDLHGEGRPVIPKPHSPNWNITALPWMSFGYNLSISPMQTAMIYNAVANNGKMMRPYLLDAVCSEGIVVRENRPRTVVTKICSGSTIDKLRKCLEGVCTQGTAKRVFKGCPYKVAGKTGTSKLANDGKGYFDNWYRSSFAGFFPSNAPKYTCVVVILNARGAVRYYGAEVAAPVFKDISDRLYNRYLYNESKSGIENVTVNVPVKFLGNGASVRRVLRAIGHPMGEKIDSLKKTWGWYEFAGDWENAQVRTMGVQQATMPSLKGFTAKDALVICENHALRVSIKGKGKVASQSIAPNQRIAPGNFLQLMLD